MAKSHGHARPWPRPLRGRAAIKHCAVQHTHVLTILPLPGTHDPIMRAKFMIS